MSILIQGVVNMNETMFVIGCMAIGGTIGFIICLLKANYQIKQELNKYKKDDK